MAFALLGEIRCLIPPSVKVMALTATATRETLKIIKKRLVMKDTAVVALPPDRGNIRYSVQPDQSLNELSTDQRS